MDVNNNKANREPDVVTAFLHLSGQIDTLEKYLLEANSFKNELMERTEHYFVGGRPEGRKPELREQEVKTAPKSVVASRVDDLAGKIIKVQELVKDLSFDLRQMKEKFEG